MATNFDPRSLQVGDLILAQSNYPDFGIRAGATYPIIRIEHPGSPEARYHLGNLKRDGCLMNSTFTKANPDFVPVWMSVAEEEDVQCAPIDDIL